MNLVCGADSKCHNDPRVEGEACGAGAPCGNGLFCTTGLKCKRYVDTWGASCDINNKCNPVSIHMRFTWYHYSVY